MIAVNTFVGKQFYKALNMLLHSNWSKALKYDLNLMLSLRDYVNTMLHVSNYELLSTD